MQVLLSKTKKHQDVWRDEKSKKPGVAHAGLQTKSYMHDSGIVELEASE